MPHFLRFFTKDRHILDLGLRYSNIVFAFSIIIALNLSFEKIFQAVGKMKVTMIALMCGCLTNIFLDPVMIFGLGPFPRNGNRGRGHCHRDRAGGKPRDLSGGLPAPPHSCTYKKRLPETGQRNRSSSVFHRDSGSLEPGPAFSPDIRTEQSSLAAFFPELCGNPGNLL